MKIVSVPLLSLVLIGELGAQGTDQVRVNWAENDVRWIICPEEEAVFGRLNTDAERKEFVRQFWYRRDPKPETPINEAREEHYRRREFADRHFRENDVAGSSTERGRILIMYGPPQRREVHPLSPDNPFSNEVWHYDRIPDVGENLDLRFVDTGKTGEYRLSLTSEERRIVFTFWPCGKTILEMSP